MRPRERILATLRHELPDRTPTDGWFHDVVEERLKKHFRTDDWSEVLRQLGIEGWKNVSLRISFPEFERRSTPRPGDKKGPRAIWLDERTYQDAWGTVHRFGEGDWYEERVRGALDEAQTLDEILRYPFPTEKQIQEDPTLPDKIASFKSEGFFVSGGIPNPYKQAWHVRGLENVLADYILNPEILSAIYDRLYALYGEIALRLTRAGVDMITVTGDIAMQDRIVMGPDAWRRMDKPRLAQLIACCRSINPDVYFFIHSDGNIMDLMDDLIEIGFNVINPVQPECMNPAEVKRRWGERITIHGGISLQRTLPRGTPDDVRQEVETLIRECGYNGGLVVFPSNVIQPDTPTENIIACFHTARDFKLR
ncbi:MAG: uroporphyrinogen decarboxylase family protein [Kiritimatiellia bacterium]